ncbi:C2 domain [Phytophthora cinnamomi]|uniref:C2 domain n=1 Tax=Phytophthora cinnamomi TaxID=4785 RepID=UPI00355A6748|nr:C2 domain [Phytophthora cinnamomi]
MVKEHTQPPPTTSRFRAFTTALGFKPAMARSSSDQSSAASLQHQRPASTSALRPLYGNFTLYLRVHSARGLPAVSQSSYCKLYLGDSPIIGGFGQGKSLVGGHDSTRGSSHQTFHTKVQASAARDCPEWNEKFQLNVRDPNAEVLTIRVKNHVLIYSPALGACVVHLRQLQLGATVDEWFPLYKHDKASGELRLQICLQENGSTQEPKRRYSQPSEETIQRLMQQHRELEEAQRRELELEQQERWRQMEAGAMKRVVLEEQVEREEKWRLQCEQVKEKEEEEQRQRQQQQQQKHFQAEDSDSDLPASFKNRGVKKQEEVAATQMMSDLNLRTGVEKKEELEMKFGVPSGYTIYGVDSGTGPLRELTSFGTIRLSVEDLEQVVQNALPSSDSSDSTESERESRRRRRRDREERKKRRGRTAKKHSKRRMYSDEDSSSSSSAPSTGYRKKSSRVKVPEEKVTKKKSTHSSVSSRSEQSNQNQVHGNQEIPVTMTFPPSDPEELSSTSSEEERRRRHRHQADKAKKREKERKRRSKRKHAKSRRNYESKEERLRRKLKKIKSKKAQARAKLNESGDSRASTRTSALGSGAS